MPEEMGIYRGEVLTIMEALADFASAEFSRSWRTVMKRKKRTPEERAAADARSEELVRRLRELVAKGRAELEAKRAQESA